ncbi:MAG: MBL fold metallo-hydrolase [Pleomorphochaeta sp.]
MHTCTVLFDNSVENFPHAKNGHGLSLFIEVDDLSILFDTGPNSDFIYNATLLKKNLNAVDTVILSHSHYDHCCGYREFVERYRCRELICGSRFFFDKYALIDGMYYYKGVNFDDKFLNCHVIHTDLVENCLKLTKNISIHSSIKNTESFEPLPKRYFFRDSKGYKKDEFLDESVMVIDKGKDLTLIVGCSHPGIVSIVKHVSKVHKKPVKTIIGGIHLLKAKKERIDKVIDELENHGVETVYFGHCTGKHVVERMKERESKIAAHYFSTGAVIEL